MPTFIACLLCAVVSLSAHAETIKIPISQQHPELNNIERPQRGESQQLVLQRYGQPVEKMAARGTPPISRWEYPGFTVYFENQHTVHSVIKHRPQVDKP